MKSYLHFAIVSIAIILLQILIVNHIEINGLINPFIYIYLILIVPPHTNKVVNIFIGFAIGLIIDALSNSWGMHMAATTLTSYLRPYIFTLCASQEDTDKTTISHHTMPATFIKFASLLTFIHHIALFTLEAFSFNHYWFTLLKTLISSIITIIIILIFEYIRTINIKTQHR